MKRLIALIVSCSGMSIAALEPVAERHFEDAVQLIKEAKLVYPGYHLGQKDDREGLLRYDEAGKVVLGVAKTEPEKIREIMNVLVSEVERLAWDDYTEVANGYKINLVKALGYLGDKSLLNFFLGQCRYGVYAADGLSRLAGFFTSRLTKEMDRGPHVRIPSCAQAALTKLAESIRDEYPFYTVEQILAKLYGMNDFHIPAIQSHLRANAAYLREGGEGKDVENIIEKDRKWLENLEEIIATATAKRFEEAVQLVKEKKLIFPGYYMGRKDDREGAALYEYMGIVILDVAESEPEKIWQVRDLLISEVNRLEWKYYTELSGSYKLNLVRALGYLNDPSLIGFLLGQCEHGSFVADGLSRLGRSLVNRVIEELRPGPPKVKYATCMQISLIKLAKKIKSEDPLYTVAERSALLGMLKTEAIPAVKVYLDANAEYLRETGRYDNVEEVIEGHRQWIDELEEVTYD